MSAPKVPNISPRFRNLVILSICLLGAGTIAAAATVPLGTALVLLPSLAILSVVAWRLWRTATSPWGGGPVLIFFVGCLAYLLGSVKLADEAPFGSTIGQWQWNLYLWAALASGVGVAIGIVVQPAFRRSLRLDKGPQPQTRSYPLWIVLAPALVGLVICWINYGTAGIPLLAESINDHRRSGGTALLSQWSFASYSSLEFVIIAASVLPLRRTPWWVRLVLVGASVSTLLMSGSRAFLVLPVVALSFIAIEALRPRLVTIASIAVILALAVGGLGQLRSIVSGTGANVSANAEKWGYGPPVTAALWSPLQVGPHVFAAVAEVIPSDIPFQHGVFFLRDFPKISAGAEADYWIAEAVMQRDPLQTGGLPPTVLGGFYVDWGIPGAIGGVFAIGALLALARPRRMPFRRSQPAVIAYGLLCAYVLQSLYSYISLNISFIVMLLWCLALVFARRLDALVRHWLRTRRGTPA